MVDIISKNSAPRREDQKARALIEKNRATITRLADQLSNGAYSASRRGENKAPEKKASGLIISDLGATRPVSEPKPYVRISPNNRVVIADAASGRQMHYLGELRRKDGALRFVLATKENGIFSPVDPEIAKPLAALDGVAIGGDRTEEMLASEIRDLLDLS